MPAEVKAMIQSVNEDGGEVLEPAELDPEALRLVVDDPACDPAVQQQAAERDHERLERQLRDQDPVERPDCESQAEQHGDVRAVTAARERERTIELDA